MGYNINPKNSKNHQLIPNKEDTIFEFQQPLYLSNHLRLHMGPPHQVYKTNRIYHTKEDKTTQHTLQSYLLCPVRNHPVISRSRVAQLLRNYKPNLQSSV